MDKIQTPATDALDAVNAEYEFLEAPGAISGEDYSKAIGPEKAARLFKTLVMKGDTTDSVYVFLITHGGTSPLGMKNSFKVIFDECAGDMKTVIINGGGGGYLVELTLDEFAKAQPYELMPLKK